MQGSVLGLLLLLLTIPVSVVLIVSFSEMFGRRPDSTATNRYLLALAVHGALAVAFFHITTEQPLVSIWWGHEILLLAALTSILLVPRWRKMRFDLEGRSSMRRRIQRSQTDAEAASFVAIKAREAGFLQILPQSTRNGTDRSNDHSEVPGGSFQNRGHPSHRYGVPRDVQ